MKWLKRNLFRRLLVSYMITALLGLAVMGTIMWLLNKNYIEQSQEEEMVRQARSVNQLIQHNDTVTPEMEDTLEFLDQAYDANVWVFNRDGQIQATSTRDEVFIGHVLREDFVERILQGEVVRENLDLTEMTTPLMTVMVPWGEGDQVYGGIVLLSSVEGVNAAASNIRETVLWAMLFGTILSMIMILYLSWVFSRPINEIKEAASEIGLGNYRKRVPEDDQGEIGELSQAFNRMAAKLEKSEAERRSQDQRRDHFISNISHELRTPLTTMQGFLEALQDGLIKDEDTRQRYYDVMYQESMYLNHLVDDLMDLIKLEKGEVSLDAQFVQLEEVAEKVSFTMEAILKEKNNELELENADDLQPIVADPVRIEQILVNLIHNASKFTENGRISVDFQQDEKQTVMRIADTGIGIPSHDLTKIWDRFYKVSRVRSKKEGGTGLGLAIVKELVELHDGTIDVHSELGKGTTFSITFPHHHLPKH